jgi:hypothetical protein
MSVLEVAEARVPRSACVRLDIERLHDASAAEAVHRVLANPLHAGAGAVTSAFGRLGTMTGHACNHHTLPAQTMDVASRGKLSRFGTTPCQGVQDSEVGSFPCCNGAREVPRASASSAARWHPHETAPRVRSTCPMPPGARAGRSAVGRIPRLPSGVVITNARAFLMGARSPRRDVAACARTPRPSPPRRAGSRREHPVAPTSASRSGEA